MARRLHPRPSASARISVLDALTMPEDEYGLKTRGWDKAAVTTLTSRQFHQDSAKIKRAAKEGPVVITDRGKPSLVVLSYEAYDLMARPHPSDRRFRSVLEALYDPETADFDFEIPISRDYPKDIDLT